jgi:hypothetical protein
MWCTSTMTFAADAVPDGRQLLRDARMMQSSQEWQLLGQVRMGSQKQPMRMTIDNGSIRYEFLDNGDTITLKLGEKGSTLEERRGGKTAKVTPARFDAQVRGTDIRYEDLALRFLYWTDAKVLGDELSGGRSCWKVEVRPPGKNESQYSRVVLWIGKEDGALMKAESFDTNDKWARRFQVVDVMKHHGFWLLKKMRVESAEGRFTDPQPTYLEIKDVEKGPTG